MKTLIIYTHPWDGSFNHSVLMHTLNILEEKGNSVDVIDLYADGFDPVMRVEDLALFGKGEYNDTQAKDYVNRLKAADRVIFMFPIWWYGMPAMLKGFFDKILLKGATYTEDENKNMKGLLEVKESAIFTTANISKNIFEKIGDPIKNTMINGMFDMVGIGDTTWIHADTIHLEESRLKFMDEIEAYLNK
jgi:NAD(P)H dehydrogenase (quinone)